MSPILVSPLKAHCTMLRCDDSPGRFSSVDLILFTGRTVYLLSLARSENALSDEMDDISNWVASVNNLFIVPSDGSISRAKLAICTISRLSSTFMTVSYTHLRAHETVLDLVC